MQLVLSGNRVIAHGENFLSMGGTVVNTETGACYQNATVAECDGCPADIDSAGYEYHAGVFVPVAPYGTAEDGHLMVACDCGTPKRAPLLFSEVLALVNTYASVTVSYPAGAVCTCSNGETVLTADGSGEFEFRIPKPGTWAITIKDGEETSSINVVITKRWQCESLVIAFFEAFITVTYPAGSVCTCTDGVTTLTADDSGTYTFRIPTAGSWTVAVTDGTETDSEVVAVTEEGTTTNVELTYFEATIAATFPAGWVCTCSNGSDTYTAPTTSGAYTFTVPKAGTWTLRATNSGMNIDKSASITEDGQSVSVELLDIYFFNSGEVNTDTSGGWTSDGFDGGSGIKEGSIGTISDGCLYVETSGLFSNGIIGMANALDLTGIDKINFAVVSCTTANDSYFIVSKTKDVDDKVLEAKATATDAHTVTMDVSALSGEHYIFMYVHVYDYVTTRHIKVSDFWLSIDAAGTIKAIDQSVALTDTYRYANSLQAGDWVKLSDFNTASLKTENYVGQGTKDYNVMMIPVPAFTYEGTFKSLKMSLRVWVSDKSNHTFRWAVSTTKLAAVYKTAVGAVTETGQLGQGTFTPDYNNGAVGYQSFDLECEPVASGTPIYIYLWRDNTNYGNIHVTSNSIVSLSYAKA